MDLERLTKHQVVLLTLLVSFVTSIATGIVTVSLMSQEPGGVTRTINQIVERTVERVVPTEAAAPAAVAAATPQTVTERTVVVRDDDLAAASIAEAQKAMVRITEKGSDLLLTRGVIFQGAVAIADRSAIIAAGGKDFEAILYSGERVPATLRLSAATSSIAVLDLSVGTSTGFAAAKLADVSKLKLGQSVIRIGGTGADVVGTGVLARLPSKDSHSNLIEASVSSVTPGSVLITLFGEVVGIITGDAAAQSPFNYTTVDSAPAVLPTQNSPAASSAT